MEELCATLTIVQEKLQKERNATMLDIRDLRFEAEGTEILNGIDLQVESGRFLAITGPNGGGKTTLAKAIMGIYEPTGGSIFYNGADITHMSITERARQGISSHPGSRG